MKKCIFLLNLCLFSCALFGQITKEISPSAIVKKNVVYFEVQGSSANYAFHYNRVLFQRPSFFLDADIGVGINRIQRPYPYTKLIFNDLYSSAVCLNITEKRNKGTYFFLGVGGTYGNLHPFYTPIKVPKGFIYPIFGVKYQPLNEHIFFKFYLSPHYARARNNSYSPETSVFDMNLGVSLGYAFDDKKKASSQNIDSIKKYKNAVFLQFFGESGVIGLGYSRMLAQKRNFFWDIRGAINLNFVGYVPPISHTSAGTSLNWGHKKHYFETGISYMPISAIIDGGRSSFLEFYKLVIPVIGYKVLSKHFFFRAHFTPIFGYTSKYIPFPSGGLSFGYAF